MNASRRPGPTRQAGVSDRWELAFAVSVLAAAAVSCRSADAPDAAKTASAEQAAAPQIYEVAVEEPEPSEEAVVEEGEALGAIGLAGGGEGGGGGAGGGAYGNTAGIGGAAFGDDKEADVEKVGAVKERFKREAKGVRMRQKVASKTIAGAFAAPKPDGVRPEPSVAQALRSGPAYRMDERAGGDLDAVDAPVALDGSVAKDLAPGKQRAWPESPPPPSAGAERDVERDTDRDADRDAMRDDNSGDRAHATSCLGPPEPSAPLPRRCHLAPTYHAGTAAWQRRLRALAELPAALAATAWSSAQGPQLEAPEGAALAVDARLDRVHTDGPRKVWMRVALRSTERWGMRRPPFDLAVVLGPQAAAQPDAAACTALQALVDRVEPQDRVTFVFGAGVEAANDGVAGTDAAARVRALCAAGVPTPSASLAAQHRAARAALARHAAAQHRVAGTRLVVVVAAANEDGQDALAASVAEAVAEPTLTSALLVGETFADDAWWGLVDAGHGALEFAPGGAEARAAAALWDGWGRVVARLVRVDIRLAPGVVAHHVVGSRVLDAEETRAVREREQAIDRNLARVAGVAADRQDDGEGMTMLIPAFLGSDHHVIDVLLSVPGPGPVADVVVDYKDLVRMSNQVAMARAALGRLPNPLARVSSRADLAGSAAASAAVARRLAAAVRAGQIGLDPNSRAALEAALPPEHAGLLALALDALDDRPELRPAVLALLDAWVARANGCHVVASPAR